MLGWASKKLKETGFEIRSNQPGVIKQTPWSNVFCYETTKGLVYLKQMPEAIAMEPKVIELLRKNFSAAVPEVLAENTLLHCFLMKDAGRPLREKLKQQFDKQLLCEAAEQFTALQLNIANHLGQFFEIGVPDWRLDKLPQLYGEVISDEGLLLSEGFSKEKLAKLKHYEKEILNWSDSLAEFAIPESIIQPDFHDNNLLVDDKTNKLTWIDLGEVLISHPLFALFTYLMQIKKHHGLSENDRNYQEIKSACFNPYRKIIGSDLEFERAITLAEKLNLVYGIAYQYRFMQICNKEALAEVGQWKLKQSINQFLEMML